MDLRAGLGRLPAGIRRPEIFLQPPASELPTIFWLPSTQVRFPIRTFLLTSLTLLAFAANSVICRMALAPGWIDPGSFTLIRFTSGAVTLWIIVRSMRQGGSAAMAGSWLSAFMLASYGVFFSFAYITLSAGTGALILFAAVQLTMILAGLRSGERPGAVQWAGFFVAFGGLVYLVSPGLTAPDPVGSVLMTAAGVSWGVYSVRGKGAGDPVRTTAGNFVRSVPFVAAPGLIFIGAMEASTEGVLLALLSGSVTSGLGYVLWYSALKGLTHTRAALAQLAVPVIAAAGGVLLLSEEVTLRLVLALLIVPGGIALGFRRSRQG